VYGPKYPGPAKTTLQQLSETHVEPEPQLALYVQVLGVYDCPQPIAPRQCPALYAAPQLGLDTQTLELPVQQVEK